MPILVLSMPQFFCIFEYMGARKKYETEEERLEARKESDRMSYLRRRGISTREDCANSCKHTRINLQSIKYDVATMDRIALTTMYIECVISVLFTKDQEALRRLKIDIHDRIKAWLSGQDIWDKNNYIYVFEIPELNKRYSGSFRNVGFELHVKRMVRPVSYAWNVRDLQPLVDCLTETIKKTCGEAGLILAHRPSNNKKGFKMKDYVDGLTANSETTISSQPQSS